MNILKKLFGRSLCHSAFDAESIKNKKNANLSAAQPVGSSAVHNYFKTGLFNKIISILVTACFVISIVNLPAFADSETDIIEKNKKKMTTNESVSESVYNPGTSTTANKNSSVYKTQNIKEEDNGVLKTADGKEGTIVIKDGDFTVNSPNNPTHSFLPDRNLKQTVIGKALDIEYKKNRGENDKSLKENTVNVVVEAVGKVKKELSEGNRDLSSISKKTNLSEDTVDSVLSIIDMVKKELAVYEGTKTDKTKEEFISYNTGLKGHFLSEEAVSYVLEIINDIEKSKGQTKKYNNNQKLNQASPVVSAMNGFSSTSQTIIEKGPFGAVANLSYQGAIYLFNDDKNNNKQTTQVVTDQQEKTALSNVSDSFLNKNEYNEAAKNIFETGQETIDTENKDNQKQDNNEQKSMEQSTDKVSNAYGVHDGKTTLEQFEKNVAKFPELSKIYSGMKGHVLKYVGGNGKYSELFQKYVKMAESGEILKFFPKLRGKNFKLKKDNLNSETGKENTSEKEVTTAGQSNGQIAEKRKNESVEGLNNKVKESSGSRPGMKISKELTNGTKISRKKFEEYRKAHSEALKALANGELSWKEYTKAHSEALKALFSESSNEQTMADKQNKENNNNVKEEQNKKDNQQTLTKEQQEYFQKEQELLVNIEKDFGKDAEEIFDEIATQTGLSKEEVYNEFQKAGVTKENFEKAAKTLKSQLNNGAKVINVSAASVAEYLNISKAKAAIQLLAADINSGTYTQNNKAGDNQIKTSIWSLSKILTKIFDSINKAKEQSVENKIKQEYGEDGYKILKEITDKANSERKDGEPEITIEQVYNEFKNAGVTKEQLKEVSKTLLSQISNGAKIINCSAGSLSSYLGISEILASIQQLAVDIAENLFLKHNKAGDSQIKTSMLAQQKVCEMNGKSSEGYKCNLDDFMAGLKPGESAIMWVNGDHYITINKKEDGSFGVTDINVNDGKEVIYSEQEFKKLMNNEEAVGKDAKTGKEVKCEGYKATDENGNVTVLTDSASIAEKGEKLSEEQMKEISGASHTETRTYTVTRTRTVTKTRMETREGTATATGYDSTTGQYYEYSYTYTYEVEVEYEEEEEYEEEVTEEIVVEDEEDLSEEEKQLSEQEQQEILEERNREVEEEARQRAIEEANERIEQEQKEREKQEEEQGIKVKDVKDEEVNIQIDKTITKEDGSSETTSYNEKGEKIGYSETVKNENGTTTEKAYYANGKLKAENVTDKDGNIQSGVEYYENGNKKSETNKDWFGNTKTTEYSEDGKKQSESVKDRNGDVTTTKYKDGKKTTETVTDKNGNLKSEVGYRTDNTKEYEKTTDKNGNITTTNYNEKGTTKTKETVTDKNGNFKSKVEYQADGITKKSEATVDKNGNITTANYAEDGKTKETEVTVDKKGNIKVTNYNEKGEVTGYSEGTIDKKGNIKATTYDAKGNKTGSYTTTVDEQGNTTTVNYDLQGNKTGTSKTVKNADGTTTTTNYDANNKEILSKTVNEAGKVIDENVNKDGTIKTNENQMDPEKAGKTKTETDANGNEIKTNYDENGKKLSEEVTDKDGNVTVTSFDQNGKKAAEVVTDKNGNLKSEIVYQEDGKTKISETVQTEDGKLKTVNYDENGKQVGYSLTTETEKGLNVEHYDVNGKKIGSSETVANEDGTVTVTDYDANGKKTAETITDSNGDVQSFVEYYENGNKKTELNIDENGNLKTAEYYEDGKQKSELVTDGNGEIQSYVEYYENGNKKTEISKGEEGKLKTVDYDENGKKKSEKYQNEELINAMLAQGVDFGITDEDLFNEFEKAGITKEQFDQMSPTLLNQLKMGASIINCATDSTSNVVDPVANPNKFIMALQLLSVDIASGNYLSNNANQDGTAKNQIYTSGDSIKAVQNMLGINSNWISTKVNDFISNLKENESGNVYVGDHYVTAKKNDDGSISLMDSTVNDGKAVKYTNEEFTKLLNGQQAKGIDVETGKEVKHDGYKATDENGNISVLTASKTVAEKGKELTDEETKSISGARTAYANHRPYSRALGLARAVSSAFRAASTYRRASSYRSSSYQYKARAGYSSTPYKRNSAFIANSFSNAYKSNNLASRNNGIFLSGLKFMSQNNALKTNQYNSNSMFLNKNPNGYYATKDSLTGTKTNGGLFDFLKINSNQASTANTTSSKTKDIENPYKPKSPVVSTSTEGNLKTTNYKDGSKTTEYTAANGDKYIRNYDSAGNYIGGTSYNSKEKSTTSTKPDGKGGYYHDTKYSNGYEKKTHTDAKGNESTDWYDSNNNLIKHSDYDKATNKSTVTDKNGNKTVVDGKYSYTVNSSELMIGLDKQYTPEQQKAIEAVMNDPNASYEDYQIAVESGWLETEQGKNFIRDENNKRQRDYIIGNFYNNSVDEFADIYRDKDGVLSKEDLDWLMPMAKDLWQNSKTIVGSTFYMNNYSAYKVFQECPDLQNSKYCKGVTKYGTLALTEEGREFITQSFLNDYVDGKESPFSAVEYAYIIQAVGGYEQFEAMLLEYCDKGDLSYTQDDVLAALIAGTEDIKQELKELDVTEIASFDPSGDDFNPDNFEKTFLPGILMDAKYYNGLFNAMKNYIDSNNLSPDSYTIGCNGIELKNEALPEGEYSDSSKYSVFITFAGEKDQNSGEYNFTAYKGITEKGGHTANSDSIGDYKIFGVEMQWGDTTVVSDHLYQKMDGGQWTDYSSVYNIYFINDESRIWQDFGSGGGGDGGSEKFSMTNAIIDCYSSGCYVRGSGNRVSVDAETGDLLIAEKGSRAKYGSVFRQQTSSGKTLTAFTITAEYGDYGWEGTGVYIVATNEQLADAWADFTKEKYAEGATEVSFNADPSKLTFGCFTGVFFDMSSWLYSVNQINEGYGANNANEKGIYGFNIKVPEGGTDVNGEHVDSDVELVINKSFQLKTYTLDESAKINAQNNANTDSNKNPTASTSGKPPIKENQSNIFQWGPLSIGDGGFNLSLWGNDINFSNTASQTSLDVNIDANFLGFDIDSKVDFNYDKTEVGNGGYTISEDTKVEGYGIDLNSSGSGSGNIMTNKHSGEVDTKINGNPINVDYDEEGLKYSYNLFGEFSGEHEMSWGTAILAAVASPFGIFTAPVAAATILIDDKFCDGKIQDTVIGIGDGLFNTGKWATAWTCKELMYADMWWAEASGVSKEEAAANAVLHFPLAADAMDDEEKANFIGDNFFGNPNLFYYDLIKANNGNPLSINQWESYDSFITGARNYYYNALYNENPPKSPNGVELTPPQIDFYKEQLDRYNNAVNKNEIVKQNIEDVGEEHVKGIDINSTVITDIVLSDGEAQLLLGDDWDPNKTYVETRTVNIDGNQNISQGNVPYIGSCGITDANLVDVTTTKGDAVKFAGVKGTYTYKDPVSNEDVTVDVGYEIQFTRGTAGNIIPGVKNAYLLDYSSVSQKKPKGDGDSDSSGSSSLLSDLSSQPVVQTSGILNETDSLITITGPLSKFTIDADNNPSIYGKGMQALPGSSLYVPVQSEGKTIDTYIVVTGEEGGLSTGDSYIHDGTMWVNSSGACTYKFDTSTDDKKANAQQFVDTILNSSITSEKQREITIDDNKEIDFTKEFSGSFYSPIDMVWSLKAQGISCNIKCERGDNVAGETLNQETYVSLDAEYNYEGDRDISFIANNGGSGIIQAGDNGFEIDGQSAVDDSFKEGEKLGFAAYLERTGTTATNTVQIEGLDGEIYNPGEVTVAGEGGCLVLAAEIGLDYNPEADTVTKSNKPNNRFYWCYKGCDYEQTGSDREPGKGKAAVFHLIKDPSTGKFSCFITGDIVSNGEKVKFPPESDDNNDEEQNGGSSSKMTFDGRTEKDDSDQIHMYGVFHNCDSRDLSTKYFSDALVAPGSRFLAGSVMGNGQQIDHDITIGQNGEWKIDEMEWFNTVNWKEKGIDGFGELINWGHVANWVGFTAGQVFAGILSISPISQPLQLFRELEWLGIDTESLGLLSDLSSGLDKYITKLAYGYEYVDVKDDKGSVVVDADKENATSAMKVTVVAAIAVATAAFVILTGGAGAAAIPEILSGEAVLIGSVGEITLSSIATAAVTTYFVTSAAINAIECYERGDWAGMVINIIAGLVAFLCPFKIELGATGAETLAGLSTKIGSKVASSPSTLAEFAANFSSRQAAVEFVKSLYSKAVDFITNIPTKVTDFFTSNIFSKEAWKTGVKNGINDVKTSIKDITGLNGAYETIRTTESGLKYFNGGMFGAFDGLSQGMWTMTKLQFAMNAVGQLLIPGKVFFNGSLDFLDGIFGTDFFSSRLEINDSTWAGQLYNFVFSDMEQQAEYNKNIFVIDPAQSFTFSVIMYIGMPFFQGLANSLKTPVLPEVGANEMTSNSVSQFIKNNAKEIIDGIYEEQVTENIIQYGLTSIGVPPEMAEVLSEFFSPDGVGYFNSETFGVEISKTKSSQKRRIDSRINRTIKNTGASVNFNKEGFSYAQNNKVETVTVENDLQTHNAEIAAYIVAKNGGTSEDFKRVYNALNNGELLTIMGIEDVDEGKGYTSEQIQHLMFALESIDLNKLIKDIKVPKEKIDKNKVIEQNIKNNHEAQQLYEQGKVVPGQDEWIEQAEQEAFNKVFNEAFTEAFVEKVGIMYKVAAANNNFLTKGKGIYEINQNSRIMLLQTISESKYLDKNTGKINQKELIDAINRNDEGALDEFLKLSYVSFLNAKLGMDLGFDVNEVINSIEDVDVIIENEIVSEISSIKQQLDILKPLKNTNPSLYSKYNDQVNNLEDRLQLLEQRLAFLENAPIGFGTELASIEQQIELYSELIKSEGRVSYKTLENKIEKLKNRRRMVEEVKEKGVISIQQRIDILRNMNELPSIDAEKYKQRNDEIKELENLLEDVEKNGTDSVLESIDSQIESYNDLFDYAKKAKKEISNDLVKTRIVELKAYQQNRQARVSIKTKISENLLAITDRSIQIEETITSHNIFVEALMWRTNNKLLTNEKLGIKTTINVHEIADSTVEKINALALSQEELNAFSSKDFYNLIDLQKISNVDFDNDLKNAINNYNEKIKNFEEEIKGKSLEEQVDIINQKQEQLKQSKKDNIADRVFEEYLDNKFNNIKQDIIKNNKNKFNIVTSKTGKGYELVKGDRKFEVFIDGKSYGTFNMLDLYDMGILENSDFKFNYNKEKNKLEINVNKNSIEFEIDIIDINSLLMNQQFKELLIKNLDNNKIIEITVERNFSEYSDEYIEKYLKEIGVKPTNSKENREKFINEITKTYKENLEVFFLAYSKTLLGNANSDALRFINEDIIQKSKGIDYSEDAGQATYVSIPDSFALLEGMENRLKEKEVSILKENENIEKIEIGDKKNINGDTKITIITTTNRKVEVPLDIFSDFVGFGEDYKGLLFRLKALAEYQKNGEINKAKQIELENSNWLAEYRKEHGIKDKGSLEEGALDKYGEYIRSDKFKNNLKETLGDGFVESNLEEYQLLAVRLFANQMVKESGIFGGAGLRASQMELLSALLRDANVALDMGGGKTVALVTDAIVDRILMGENANFEILVGNGAIGNYVGTSMQDLLKFVGMDMVAVTDFKGDGKAVDAEGLLKAYKDPNTVMIMDPTTRGHLKNDAANGGETGMKINDALNSVRRVDTDEIHLWTLTQTAAVISNGSRATSDENIKSAKNIYDKLNVKTMLSKNNFNTIINYGEPVLITSENNDKFKVKRFHTFEEWARYKNDNSDDSIMAIIGESSADVQVVFNGKIKTNLEKAGDINNAELVSFVRGLFTASDMGGADFGEDGTVKPVSTKIEENMVIGDIFFQMGYAANGWELNKNQARSKYNNIEEFIKAATRESDTSMQTSLTAIYDGADDLLALVGVSGTVLGLQQLIINRTGSSEVYMVSGGRAKIQEQRLEVYDSSSDGYKAKLIEQIQQEITNTVYANDGKGEGEQLTDILMLAKVAPSIQIFMEAIRGLDSKTLELLRKQKFVVFDRTTDTKYEINKNGELVETEYKQHYKDDKLKTDENYRDQTAKDKNIRKIIIDNDAGATGTDYQGNYKLMVLDAHMYSNTDLAQLLQRIGRPDPAGTGRGEAERVVFQDTSAINLKLENYIANSAFVEYFDKIIKDDSSDNFFYNKRAAELFNNLIENDNGVYKIKSKTADITTEQYQKDLLELTTFMTEVSNINASIRFAVSDAIRDRMILKPLRTMLSQATDPKEKAIIRKAIDDVLSKGKYDANADLGGRESAEDLNSDKGAVYIQRTINNVKEEAIPIFEALKANLNSNSVAYMTTTLNLAEIKTLRFGDINSKYNEKMNHKKEIEDEIERLRNENFEGNQKRIEELENELESVLEVKSMAQMDTLEDLVESMMLLEPYIAPTLDTDKKMELSTLMEKGSVSQEALKGLGMGDNGELNIEEAVAKGLVTVSNGKVYITDLGKIYLKISDDDDLARALALLLCKLLFGYGGDNGKTISVESVKKNLKIDDDDLAKALTAWLSAELNIATAVNYDNTNINKMNNSNAKLALAKAAASNNINIAGLSEVVKSGFGENLSELTSSEIDEIINAQHPRGLKETLETQYQIEVPSATKMKAIEIFKDKGIVIDDNNLELYNVYNNVVNGYNSQFADKYSLSWGEQYSLLKESDKWWVKGIGSTIDLAKTTAGFMMLTPLINAGNNLLGVDETAGGLSIGDSIKTTAAIQGSMAVGQTLWSPVSGFISEHPNLSITGALNLISDIKHAADNRKFNNSVKSLGEAVDERNKQENDIVKNDIDVFNVMGIPYEGGILGGLTVDDLRTNLDSGTFNKLVEKGLIIKYGDKEILTKNGRVLIGEWLKVKGNSDVFDILKQYSSYEGSSHLELLITLQEEGILAKDEENGWTIEVILEADKQLAMEYKAKGNKGEMPRDIGLLRTKLEKYRKEGIKLESYPSLLKADQERLNIAKDKVDIAQKDVDDLSKGKISKTDKAKNVLKVIKNKVSSNSGNNKIEEKEENDEMIPKEKEKTKEEISLEEAKKNFEDLKKQIAEKYENNGNKELAETVRRLSVKDGKFVISSDSDSISDILNTSLENKNSRILEKSKKMFNNNKLSSKQKIDLYKALVEENIGNEILLSALEEQFEEFLRQLPDSEVNKIKDQLEKDSKIRNIKKELDSANEELEELEIKKDMLDIRKQMREIQNDLNIVKNYPSYMKDDKKELELKEDLNRLQKKQNELLERMLLINGVSKNELKSAIQYLNFEKNLLDEMFSELENDIVKINTKVTKLQNKLMKVNGDKIEQIKEKELCSVDKVILEKIEEKALRLATPIAKIHYYDGQKEAYKKKNYKNLEKELNKKIEKEIRLLDASERVKLMNSKIISNDTKNIIKDYNQSVNLIEEVKEVKTNQEYKEVIEKYAHNSKAITQALSGILDVLLDKGIIKIEDSQAYKDFVSKMVFGITKPGEYNDLIAAVLAQCSNANEIAQALFFNDISEVEKATPNEITNEIMNRFWEKANEIEKLNISDKEKIANISMLVVARDILLAVNSKDISAKQLNDKNLKPSQIETAVLRSKAVNMNLIVKNMVDVYKTNSVTVNGEDFVIDIMALQQTVSNKKAVEEARKSLQNGNWDAILAKSGRGSADKTIALMNLSNIKAVAAAA